MSAFEDDIREYDAKFEAWKTQNPGRTFAEYTTSLIVKGIEKGRPHSSLGPNLKDAGDWWEAGRPSWWSIRTHHMIRNTDKVVDYGCGSLRIGAHFMKKHFQSCYFGLDVTTDFINYGLKILDDDFLRRKKPETGTIKDDLERAIAFNADVVFTANVANQIHPDETDQFFKNLKNLMKKPNGAIIIHASVYREIARLKRVSWARPIEFFDQNMLPFIRIASTHKMTQDIRGMKVPTYLLTYQMPV